MSSESSSSRVYRRKSNRESDSVHYIIYVDDERFVLTHGQLQSEPGNLLNLKAIPAIGHERDDDTIIETDINLFRLIHAHLTGFEIFPLPPQGIPFRRKTGNNGHLLYLSPEATLKNLLRDATDFGLTNLVAKIKQEIANQAKASNVTNPQPTDDDHEASKEFGMLD